MKVSHLFRHFVSSSCSKPTRRRERGGNGNALFFKQLKNDNLVRFFKWTRIIRCVPVGTVQSNGRMGRLIFQVSIDKNGERELIIGERVGITNHYRVVAKMKTFEMLGTNTHAIKCTGKDDDGIVHKLTFVATETNDPDTDRMDYGLYGIFKRCGPRVEHVTFAWGFHVLDSELRNCPKTDSSLFIDARGFPLLPWPPSPANEPVIDDAANIRVCGGSTDKPPRDAHAVRVFRV
jgi:hypothetical protein